MAQIGNIFAQGMDAYDHAYSTQKAIGQDRAKIQAGRAIAGGDYTGGANLFNQAGMVEEGHNVLADQLALKDRQTADANLVEDRATKAKAQALEMFGKGIDAIGAVSEGQRLPYIQKYGDDLKLLGIPVERFQGKTEADLSDAALAPLKGAIHQAKEAFTLKAGERRFDGAGREVASVPEDQKYMPIAAGGALVPVPRGGMAPQTVTAGPQGTPGSAPGAAPAMPAMPAMPASGDPSAPRGVRNNNPVNVTNLAHGQWDGQTGSDGQYATFGSPEAGMAAADKNLQAYGRLHGINTLAGIINRWAPEAGGNDPAAYIATVGKAIGITPNQPIDLSDPKARAVVLHAMSKVELGTGGTGRAPPPTAAVASTPNDGLPPGTIRGPPKPMEWTQDGKGNLINANGDRKVDTTAGADVIANPNLVRAIINGTAPAPTAARQATDPKWQAAYAEALAQDPTLDATNYGTRAKTRIDFATGAAAKTKTALNTALGHAGDLDGQVDALRNSPIRVLNKAGNYFATETGDPRMKTFDLTKEALLHEAMKVFSGSQGSMTEFARLAETLTVDDSPSQQHSVIKKLVGLLASKMDALGEQYKTGMGKELEQSQIMSSHASAIFNKISGLPNAAAPPARPGAPKVIRYDAQGNRVQ